MSRLPTCAFRFCAQDRGNRSRGGTPTGSYERGHGFAGRYANGVADKRKGGGGGFLGGSARRPGSRSPDRGFLAAAADKLAAGKLSGTSPSGRSPSGGGFLRGSSPPPRTPRPTDKPAGGRPAAAAEKPAAAAATPEETAAVKQQEGSVSSVAARIAKLEVGTKAASAAAAPGPPARIGSFGEASALSEGRLKDLGAEAVERDDRIISVSRAQLHGSTMSCPPVVMSPSVSASS